MIFVNSMSDLFHEKVPDEYIVKVARVMTAANWHTYQILTKRAGRMQKLLKGKLRFAAEQPHIWWGVSVENRKHGLPRIDLLRDSPAQVRFLSIEPLLEHLGTINLRGINWVIVGGESGPGARPMAADWVRDIRAQCQQAKVAFFFKQWGGVRKKEAGRELDGAPTTNFPNAGKIRCRIWNSGGMRWCGWKRIWFDNLFVGLLVVSAPNKSSPVAKGDHSAREAITFYNPHEEREADKAPLQWPLIRRIFRYTKPYAAKRNWLFVLTFLRGLQLPALAWLIGRTINGPIANATCRKFTRMQRPILPWRCSRL